MQQLSRTGKPIKTASLKNTIATWKYIVWVMKKYDKSHCASKNRGPHAWVIDFMKTLYVGIERCNNQNKQFY
jgi:hypothetical protein